MIETTDDKKVIERTAKKNKDQIEYLGILIFGDKKQVESMTAQYSLYSGENQSGELSKK